MTAYYNEIDPYAAQWLRNLIAAGHIAQGDVDERSIEDVTPDDLRPYTQCHFFAGVGVWSYALRQAGWPDDQPVWTGSCPCQPFSAAGAGAGFADPRHLWPSFAWLIGECRPPVIFGEQVASKAVGPWVDLVHANLEAMAYAFGAVPFPAAGVGAPHIRDRLYWVADADSERQQGPAWHQVGRVNEAGADRRINSSWMADANGGHTCAEREQCGGQQRQQSQDGGCGGVALERLGNPSCAGLGERIGDRGILGRASETNEGQAAQRAGVRLIGMANPSSQRLHRIDPLLQWEKSRRITGDSLEAVGRGPVNGFWHGADWISCRDDRWRPVEPGTFPLAHGAASRVGRLRAYGNAINAEAARIFIESYIDARCTACGIDLSFSEVDALI